MEEIVDKKREIREDMIKMMDAMPDTQRAKKTKAIEDRLFGFANFLEANISLLYMNGSHEVATENIIKKAMAFSKIIVLPAFDMEKFEMRLLKVDNLAKNLKPGPKGVLEPDDKLCKAVPIDCIDIAIVPGIAFDEKGARIGTGTGFYDRLIPELPITTRKVALAFEDQILQQIPMESHDRFVDIIVTDERIIYKI
jgi:5-formyltetrahydrofolate cyclo-ligase